MITQTLDRADWKQLPFQGTVELPDMQAELPFEMQQLLKQRPELILERQQLEKWLEKNNDHHLMMPSAPAKKKRSIKRRIRNLLEIEEGLVKLDKAMSMDYLISKPTDYWCLGLREVAKPNSFSTWRGRRRRHIAAKWSDPLPRHTEQALVKAKTCTVLTYLSLAAYG